MAVRGTAFDGGQVREQVRAPETAIGFHPSRRRGSQTISRTMRVVWMSKGLADMHHSGRARERRVVRSGTAARTARRSFAVIWSKYKLMQSCSTRHLERLSCIAIALRRAFVSTSMVNVWRG